MNCNACVRHPRSQLAYSYLEISRFVREHIARSNTCLESSKVAKRNSKFFHTSRTSPRIQNECGGSFSKRPCTQSPKILSSSVTSLSSHRRLFSSPADIGVQEQRQRDHDIIQEFQEASEPTTSNNEGWDILRSWSGNSERAQDDIPVCLHGYVTSIRPAKGVSFVQLVDPSLHEGVQLVCSNSTTPGPDAKGEKLAKAQLSWKDTLAQLSPHTPVIVTGRIVNRQQKSKPVTESVKSSEKLDPYVGNIDLFQHAEIQVDSVQRLNQFPAHIDAQFEKGFPPEQRHLLYRTSHTMRDRLQFRSKLRSRLGAQLEAKGFQEIETPLLFKSTPEGAREYIVPTRYKGLGYALPQSPQQYKQILMASGVPRYFQFARCFRDEDLRTDRQPEFTQLDMEMAFADSKAVMAVVEDLVINVMWPLAERENRLDQRLLEAAKTDHTDKIILPILTYQEAMATYGSDKPDTRIGSEIQRVDGWIPASLKGMLTSIEDPIVDMIVVNMNGSLISETRQFLSDFMKLPTSSQYSNNPEGVPGIFVYDPSLPMRGLASFGHEAAEKVEELFEPEPGDILIAQARFNKPFSGGSTMLGKIRQHMHLYAVEKGLRDEPDHDSLLWVVDFPLFSPIEEDSPGQGGEAGFCSTHHPFTAPKLGQDFRKILDDPLSVIGDHYDLVINGVEIGGGSRRIHHSKMQELIFRSVLQMHDDRIADFRHLLNALQSGCPPHAGFALGFDRLVALLRDAGSVRDVIAFPKYKDGRDLLVGSPSKLTPSQLATYHLAVEDDDKALEEEPRISMKA